jgi:predicted ribosome quality control (RQC) complex YloA/Tae2 family protein
MENPFDKKRNDLLKGMSRRLKHAVRRLQTCREELETCKRWEVVFHEAQLLQAHLFRLKKGMSEVVVVDWLQDGQERAISLDPQLTPHEQVAALFRRSKKQSKAIIHLQGQVKKREEQCAALQAAMDQLASVENEEQLAAWTLSYIPPPRPAAKKATKDTARPYRQFYTAAGLSIKVGKGAKSNDVLTFRHAKGSDWWFHTRDYAGSHVVLCVIKGKEPDPESVRDALLLALAHSKAAEEKEADIVMAQCKHIHKLKDGVPGKVQIGLHKVVHFKYDEDRLAKIKARQAPLHAT